VVLWTLQGIAALAVSSRVDRGVHQVSGKLGDEASESSRPCPRAPLRLRVACATLAPNRCKRFQKACLQLIFVVKPPPLLVAQNKSGLPEKMRRLVEIAGGDLLVFCGGEHDAGYLFVKPKGSKERI
jgi:hypothetical protein